MTIKNISFLMCIGLLVASAYFYLNFAIFVVQPIGAVPEGVTLVVKRTAQLNFVDSADAMCERVSGGVSLICRMTMLGQAVSEDGIYGRLPYSEWLYSYSTGGKSYER